MNRALGIVAIVIAALLAWLGYVVFYQDAGGAADGGAGQSGTADADKRGDKYARSHLRARQRSQNPVSGVVYGPDEEPLVGARVSLHRMVSDWPRPQLEQIETLTTGTRGHFTFRTSRGPDLMVEVNAKGCGRLLVQASQYSPELTLRLAYGFRIRARAVQNQKSPQ